MMSTLTSITDCICVIVAKNYVKNTVDWANGKAIILVVVAKHEITLWHQFHSRTIIIQIQYICLHYFYLIFNLNIVLVTNYIGSFASTSRASPGTAYITMRMAQKVHFTWMGENTPMKSSEEMETVVETQFEDAFFVWLRINITIPEIDLQWLSTECLNYKLEGLFDLLSNFWFFGVTSVPCDIRIGDKKLLCICIMLTDDLNILIGHSGKSDIHWMIMWGPAAVGSYVIVLFTAIACKQVT